MAVFCESEALESTYKLTFTCFVASKRFRINSQFLRKIPLMPKKFLLLYTKAVKAVTHAIKMYEKQ